MYLPNWNIKPVQMTPVFQQVDLFFNRNQISVLGRDQEAGGDPVQKESPRIPTFAEVMRVRFK